MSGIERVILSGKQMTREELLACKPRTIGVEICEDPTFFDEDRLVLGINHHRGVDRIGMRCSSLQLYHMTKLGLWKAFSVRGIPTARCLFARCDEDDALSSFILEHSEHIEDQRLKQLVQLEDLLDTTAGLYPVKRRWQLLKRLLWIVQPYQQARADGSLYGMNETGMHRLIDQTHERMRRTLAGRGNMLEPDMAFEEVQRFDDWSFVRETGINARIGLGQSDIKAFVSHLSDRAGRHVYTIARLSYFYRAFPIGAIKDCLNRAERTAGGTGEWGGSSDCVIGSPMGVGSVLPPEKVTALVEKACAALRRK